MTTELLSLAPELLSIIASFVGDKKDLNALTQTHSSLCHAAIPHLYSEISIAFTFDNSKPTLITHANHASTALHASLSRNPNLRPLPRTIHLTLRDTSQLPGPVTPNWSQLGSSRAWLAACDVARWSSAARTLCLDAAWRSHASAPLYLAVLAARHAPRLSCLRCTVGVEVPPRLLRGAGLERRLEELVLRIEPTAVSGGQQERVRALEWGWDWNDWPVDLGAEDGVMWLVKTLRLEGVRATLPLATLFPNLEKLELWNCINFVMTSRSDPTLTDYMSGSLAYESLLRDGRLRTIIWQPINTSWISFVVEKVAAAVVSRRADLQRNDFTMYIVHRDPDSNRFAYVTLCEWIIQINSKFRLKGYNHPVFQVTTETNILSL